ncbi:MAG: DUF4097 family beta strand repeat-containing protein [Candidatus Hodarchaeales archaeon]
MHPPEVATPAEPQGAAMSPSHDPSAIHPPAKAPHAVIASKPRSKTRLWIAIGVVVLLVFSAAVVGGLWAMFRGHHYLGEKTTEIASTTLPVFRLNITNAAGDVSIEFVDSIHVMNASAKVYGPGIADIYDAADFSATPKYGAYQLVEFDSSDGRDDLTYDIHIAISTAARTGLTIVAASGDISVSVKSPTTLTGLNLKASSGDIEVDLGTNTTLNCPEAALEVASGNIDLSWADLVVSQDMDWMIHAASGAIDMAIVQDQLPLTQTLMDFDIEVESGAIAIAYILSPSIGLQITGTALSGDVDMPGGTDSYQSANYASAVLQLQFDLHSSSGDIEVSQLDIL